MAEPYTYYMNSWKALDDAEGRIRSSLETAKAMGRDGLKVDEVVPPLEESLAGLKELRKRLAHEVFEAISTPINQP